VGLLLVSFGEISINDSIQTSNLFSKSYLFSS